MHDGSNKYALVYYNNLLICILECACALTMKCCGDYAVNIVEFMLHY